MKNRDELAEMFAVAMVGRTVDPLREWADIATDAYLLADSFIAERERRAGTPAEPDTLRFGDNGLLLLGEDKPARWYEDGAEARVFPNVAYLTIAATSRAHAERLVAVMLAAGRGVK